jgi:polyphenol oxidase
MPDISSVVRTDIESLRFDLFREIPHGISTRYGGQSRHPYASLNMGLSTGDDEETVLSNRRAFWELLSVHPNNVVLGRFSHGAAVTVFQHEHSSTVARAPIGPDSSRTESIFKSDAVISDVAGMYFFLTFADCVPLAFYDRRLDVVGAAHAGWRGTAAAVARVVVQTMKDAFGTDPADLVVGIGPSIGPCCYAVQENVIAAFRANGRDPVTASRGNQTYLDLWATNERQLWQAGLKRSSIENLRICTSCNVDRFYSHRAEYGRTGRFALCIGLP